MTDKILNEKELEHVDGGTFLPTIVNAAPETGLPGTQTKPEEEANDTTFVFQGL